MTSVIEYSKVASLLGGYYNRLGQTGYVSKGITCKFMVYLFVVDFVNAVHDFMSSTDYCMVESLLTDIFANGGCLLPFEPGAINTAYFTGVDVVNITIGAPRWMGNGSYSRVTEDVQTETDRITEREQFRSI